MNPHGLRYAGRQDIFIRLSPEEAAASIPCARIRNCTLLDPHGNKALSKNLRDVLPASCFENR